MCNEERRVGVCVCVCAMKEACECAMKRGVRWCVFLLTPPTENNHKKVQSCECAMERGVRWCVFLLALRTEKQKKKKFRPAQSLLVRDTYFPCSYDYGLQLRDERLMR